VPEDTCLPAFNAIASRLEDLLMVAHPTSAADFLPSERTLSALRAAAAACRGCDLYEPATQTVFGAGNPEASLILVGEQPGDQEDRQGLPFVGPAGRLLDQALVDAGIERDDIYVTNAVKHFKFVPRGKRRIHQKPRASEIRACRPWLEAEVDLLGPDLLVLLGATAVESVLGPRLKVMENRGRILPAPAAPCLVTVHPSSLLRIEEEADRGPAYALFVADLRRASEFLRDKSAPA